MLQSQNRGRDQNGYLLVVEQARNAARMATSVSEPHIAANQTIHGAIRIHISIDLLNGMQLVASFFKGNVASNSSYRVPVGLKAYPELARSRIELKQFSCDAPAKPA